MKVVVANNIGFSSTKKLHVRHDRDLRLLRFTDESGFRFGSSFCFVSFILSAAIHPDLCISF